MVDEDGWKTAEGNSDRTVGCRSGETTKGEAASERLIILNAERSKDCCVAEVVTFFCTKLDRPSAKLPQIKCSQELFICTREDKNDHTGNFKEVVGSRDRMGGEGDWPVIMQSREFEEELQRLQVLESKRSSTTFSPRGDLERLRGKCWR